MKKIIIKTKHQIDKIRQSWKYLNEILSILKAKTNIWVNLLELEQIAEQFMKKNNIKGAFKWYWWFPSNLCLSINDCLVHWIPKDYNLKPWDLLKIDCWVNFEWYISDSAISIVVWWNSYNEKWAKLIETTKNWLDLAIKKIVPNWKIFDYSKTIYEYIRWKWFNILRYLTWHWVWVDVHEWPYIYNRPSEESKITFFKSWMVIAVEPITSLNSIDFVENKKNGFEIFTKYWDVWAQWEYTIAINDNWIEILSWILEL